MIKLSGNYLFVAIALLNASVICANGQGFSKEIEIQNGQVLELTNLSGIISVSVDPQREKVAFIFADSGVAVSEGEIKIETQKGKIRISVVPSTRSKRIDVGLKLPPRSAVNLTTGDGEIRFSGDISTVNASTVTGTISSDVPTVDLKYQLSWTSSRPRFVADFKLEDVRERSGGRFEIKGNYKSPIDETIKRSEQIEDVPPAEGNGEESKNKENDTLISLHLTTARGIILINVPPTEVASDLRERPLTEAAKAIVKSGDSVLMNAIRRAAPKYFGEYERTLPPVDRRPVLSEYERPGTIGTATTRTALVRVTDNNNRAVPGMARDEFELLESGKPLEIISVKPVTSPVNLVLLLDVSGSVDNYVNFIRKAARNFVETVDAKDRVSMIIFNEDVKVLSGFSTDKASLSESLDTFDAGGATAYYDALAYTLAETLRPLRGERTAIVVLTDGDDNRSFLAFYSLTGAIEESGALIYPLYVPTGLIAASESSAATENIDPLRNRHLTLTSKASAEGPRLAKLSGGVYYPISQLSQIQIAYEDIARQLRTAYEINYRSNSANIATGSDPRLRVRTKRTGTFATVSEIRAY